MLENNRISNIELKNNEFEKYNINLNDLKLVNKKVIIKNSDAILGKEVSNAVQIIKRLFSNPYVVVSTIILLIIVTTAFIVPMVSPYNELDAISQSKYNSLLSFLLPSWINGGFNSKGIWGGQASFVNDLIAAKIINSSDLGNNLIIGSNGNLEVIFNPWSYLNALDNTSHFSFLGTDSIGRDIWTRLWIGTRQSIMLAFLVVIVEAIIGIIVGAYIGFHAGQKIDNFIMRLIDIIKSVPWLIWVILLMFILPGNFWTMFLVLVIIGWTIPTGRTRMFIIKVKDAEYIQAAASIGVSQTRLIFKHALPNILGKLITGIIIRIPIIILTESSLSFLGLSPNPQLATLGNLINDAKGNIEYWWYLLAPTTVFLLLTVSLQIIGNGLHDAFNPKITR